VDGTISASLPQGLGAFVDHMRTRYLDRRELVVEYVNGRKAAEEEIYRLLAPIGFYRDKAQTLRCELR
jgi:hypothetical protein